jgi:transposase
MRPSGDPAVVEQRRRRAIALLRSGHKPVEVASMLGVDRRSVRRWNAACREHGLRALRSRRNTGRPAKLDDQQRAQLRSTLIGGAIRVGFPTDLWTCPRVAATIRKLFGVSYHVDHLPRLLRSLGFSPQKPRRQAIERDEKRIAGWRYVQWPRIKKKPKHSART